MLLTLFQINIHVVYVAAMCCELECELGFTTKVNQLQASNCPRLLSVKEILVVKPGSYCRSVSHTKDGNLVVGCSRNIILYTAQFEVDAPRAVVTPTNVCSVEPLNVGTLLALSHTEQILTYQSSSLKELSRFSSG